MTISISKYLSHHLIDTVKEKLPLERISLNGIDVNMKDEEKKNALYWAIQTKSTHNAKLLISFGSALMVSPSQHAMFHAIEHNHHEVVEHLLNLGLNPNITDDMGYSALIQAVRYNSIASIDLLLRHDADLFYMDRSHNMAEDYAEKINNPKVVRRIAAKLQSIKAQESNTYDSSCGCGRKGSLCHS